MTSGRSRPRRSSPGPSAKASSACSWSRGFERCRRALGCLLGTALLGSACAWATEPARPSIHGVVRVLDRQGQPKGDSARVVVFLDELQDAPASWPAPQEQPVIRQADKRFVPEVLPILVGTTVNFLNDD